jgi:multiple sugar transport system permease protein
MSTAQAQIDAPVQSGSARPARRRQVSDKTIQWFFVLPTLILLIVMNIFPLFYSLFLSFTQYMMIKPTPPKWIGTGNYQDILGDPAMWASFATSGRYALLSVGLQTIIGFGLAMLLRAKFKASGLITTLILIPMMLSPVVVGVFWKLIYNPTYGIFNYLLGYTNPASSPNWLGDPKLALWAIVIVDVWMWSPFVMLLCLSGLNAIPNYLYEAAAIDRASSWRQFWKITLPQVAPLLLVAVLFRSIEAFKTFDLVMGLTGGGPGNSTETVSVALYRLAFLGQFNTGKSSAVAYVVLIAIVGISNVYIRYLNKIKEG